MNEKNLDQKSFYIQNRPQNILGALNECEWNHTGIQNTL